MVVPPHVVSVRPMTVVMALTSGCPLSAVWATDGNGHDYKHTRAVFRPVANTIMALTMPLTCCDAPPMRPAPERM